MAREGLSYDLRIAFEKALRQKEAVILKGVKIAEGGSTQTVDVTVRAIEEPEVLSGMVMIVFIDQATTPGGKRSTRAKGSLSDHARVLELEQELQQLRGRLQTTCEEMQSSQEELKSANEELQSTNEELQSTNEELTTSKEEMQSLNEELQTVNAEQQSKMDELARINNDMRNLLNSTEIATIFLDNEFRIRRFTKGVNKLFKLIPGDVGRPLGDIVSHLHYPEIIEEAEEVLRTLVFSERQIATADGGWYLVRIMPYRTMEEVIDGVVITFSDITAAKALEAGLREEIARLEKLVAAGSSL
ncbi:PAS domain-containing protein [Geomonas sp. Red69]|nr:PAS domain-containing protein [Geomonas diazotrophica]QXE88888.1 PAS domain-containing protein [Geomonas nitrogeniifigens]